jgi:prefoldin subunit 5
MKKVSLPARPLPSNDGSADMSEDAIQTARELATHASDIKHLQDDMDKMLANMKEMQTTLMAIEKTLSEARGGWKVLMLVGGASSVMGAGLVQLANWYVGK